MTTATTGLEDFTENLKALSDSMQNQDKRRLERAYGNGIAERAKRIAPVDTETLKQSIGVEVRGDEVFIGPRHGFSRSVNGKHKQPEVYGLFVELGTENSAAYPFMRPALDSYDPNTDHEANQILKEHLSAVSN